MPHFYFHLINDEDVPDRNGAEMSDLAEARTYARDMARFEISEGVKRDGRIVLSHRIQVEDGDGSVLANVDFGDSVEILS